MSYNAKDPKQNWLPAYVRAVADKYGLKDWAFKIESGDPDDNGVNAEVYCVDGRRKALLRFSDDFWSDPRDSQRYTVTHELTHCHTWAAMNYAESCINTNEKDALRRFEEYGTDSIAAAVAPFMPLPPAK